MEGNLVVRPGDTIKAGYNFTIPGAHAADTVTFTNPNVTLSVNCPDGSTFPVTITMSNQSYFDPAGNSNWFPSSDQNSPLTYQGSFTTPSTMCGGQTGHTLKASFASSLTDTSQDKINVRFHYSDNSPRRLEQRGHGLRRTLEPELR